MATNVELTGLARDLKKRADSGRPIRIGLIGAGEMGTDIVTQVARMPGLEIGALSALRLPNTFKAVDIAYGEEGHALHATTGSAMNNAIEQGKIAVTDDNDLILSNEMIDVIIDATGIPEVGAQTGVKAIENNKHLIMMNVEADVTIGPYLKHLADKQGVVYSLGAGDEPSSCMELIEFASALGYEIVSAGKGKNNPLDFDAIPDDYEEEARRRNMNVRLLVEFIDGSKTMVEMASIANATGLVPDIAGMHGPKADIDKLSSTLIPEADGGVLKKSGVVDYSIGKGVAPGVFVIVKMDHPRLNERLEDLKVGKGPYFTFHRPYHLTSLEVPLTIGRALLQNKIDMVPLPKPVAEVCAVAKKDMQPGETLDAIGQYCYRSWIMTTADARAAKAIPCGLLQNGTVIAPIKKGELITYSNAKPKAGSKIAELRKLQDQMIYGS